VRSATGKNAQQRLEAIYRPDQLDELDPADWAAQVGEELGGDAGSVADLEAQDAGLRAALATLDGFAKRAMKVRLDHALADDTLVPRSFRNYLASEVLAYRDALDLLRDRVADSVGRVDPRRAHDQADVVLEAARAVHAQHRALRDALLEVARARAARAIPIARQARWTAARRELELVVERPARIAEAPMAARIAALPEVEPEPEPEPPSREELIELD
jgi:hypothetical protein